MWHHFTIVGGPLLPPLSAEAEKEALTRLKVDNDPTAKTLLIEHNLRLVLTTACKFALTEEELSDFFSIGTIGLIKGIDTFNINKKNKLVTYISHCITNEILMTLRSLKKHMNMLTSYDNTISTDKDGKILTIESVLSDVKAEEQMHKLEEIEYTSSILTHSLSVLSNRELLVILYCASGMIEKEIGDILSVSRSMVNKIKSSALTKMNRVRESLTESQNYQKIINQDFVFFMDYDETFCVKLHPKFTKVFMDFTKNCKGIFTIKYDANHIILRFPIIESSYLLCAELIKYLTEHVI